MTYKFVVLHVKEDELGPEVSLLSGTNDLGDVDAGNEQLKVLHHCEK